MRMWTKLRHGSRNTLIGFLLLVVFSFGFLGSLQAEVVLTDEEWARIQALTAQITQENVQQKQLVQDLKTQLEQTKQQHGLEQTAWENSLNSLRASLSLLEAQYSVLKTQLESLTKSSKALTTEKALLEISLILSGGLNIYQGIRGK